MSERYSTHVWGKKCRYTLKQVIWKNRPLTWKGWFGGSVEVYFSGIGIRGRNLYKSYFRFSSYNFLVISCQTVPQWRSKSRRKGRRSLRCHRVYPSELHSAACLYHTCTAFSKASSPNSTIWRSSVNLQYSLFFLTLILLAWRIWWVSNNTNRWQMGFNSAF
jgi:hypothetical protein